ncbi:MAG: ubiquinone biosynthesis accessory factor UbiJ [Porticoccaceae bacterium]
MIFAALHSAALEGVEKIINAALMHDPSSAQKLASMAGRIVLIDSTMPALCIALELTPNGVMLHHNWQDKADICISGTLVSIAAMAIQSEQAVSLSGSGVNVSGNLDMLRQLNHIMADLDIDWEAALAQLIGDVPAHMVANSVRKSASFRADMYNRAQSAVVEVSQEELRLTPSRHEYQQFAQSVRNLATDTDRLLARANKIGLLIQQRDMLT